MPMKTNRLLGRPAVADDMLLSTYQPTSAWHFEVVVPENRVGLVAAAISSSRQAADVEFILTSFPDRWLAGQLSRLGAQPISSAIPSQSDPSQRVVMARVEIDSNTLPIKKDGAIAQASIACGRVPLVWLVFRDAYNQLSSRIRMLW